MAADLEPQLIGTLHWKRLRGVLLDALMDAEYQHQHSLTNEDVTTLYAFVGEHWGALTPREQEVGELLARLRATERERDMLRQHLARSMGEDTGE